MRYLDRSFRAPLASTRCKSLSPTRELAGTFKPRTKQTHRRAASLGATAEAADRDIWILKLGRNNILEKARRIARVPRFLRTADRTIE